MGDSNSIEDTQEINQGQHGHETHEVQQTQGTCLAQESHIDGPANKLDVPPKIQETLAQETHLDGPAHKLDDPPKIQEAPEIYDPLKTQADALNDDVHEPDSIQERARVDEPLKIEGAEQDQDAQPAIKTPAPQPDPPEDQPGPALEPTQDQSTFVVADEDEYLFDGDSAFGASSDVTDTVSLNSSLMRFREENGRKYHSFGSTEHWGPCDEDALDQQDISHHFWTLMLKGELYLAPVKNPHRILDIGCGTGIWVIDVAEKHPNADVKGIDVAPIQPAWVPPNARFELSDFNIEWGDDNKYDLIHERELLGSVMNWPKFYERCFRTLKPGGWINCSEPSAFFESYYGTIGPDHPYKMWEKVMLDSGDVTGMPFHVGPFIKERLEAAGFINVVEKKICCTIGKWSSDPWERELGVWEQLRLERGIQHFCERRCINNLGWRAEEVMVFGAQMRAALKNNKLLAHHWFYLVVGQKPEE